MEADFPNTPLTDVRGRTAFEWMAGKQFSEGIWRLWRNSADFSPLDFSQRFTGTFTEDGMTIAGSWESSSDGSSSAHDFDLIYNKVT